MLEGIRQWLTANMHRINSNDGYRQNRKSGIEDKMAKSAFCGC